MTFQNASGLVSVITIFLNGKRFLRETAESLFGQTYSNWEWLLVDDGSTDGSADLARDFALAHPSRVTYLCHEGRRNLGMSASRNLGVSHARGEYLAMLDADDVWHKDKLEVQVAILEVHADIALVYGPLYFWYSWPGNVYKPSDDFVCKLGETHDVVVQPPEAVLRQIRIADGLPGTCSVTMRTHAVRAVGGFEVAFRGMYEDEVFFSKMFMRYPAYRMSTHHDLYRQHEDSHSVAAIRSGDYVMGPGIPSRSRYRFLKWLLDYAESEGRPEVSQLIRDQLRERYSAFDDPSS